MSLHDGGIVEVTTTNREEIESSSWQVHRNSETAPGVHVFKRFLVFRFIIFFVILLFFRIMCATFYNK